MTVSPSSGSSLHNRKSKVGFYCDPPEDPCMEAGEEVEGSQAQHTQHLAPQEALLGGGLEAVIALLL